MSKIMSVFEKLNLVEKANQENLNTSDNDHDILYEEIETDNAIEDIEEENDVEFQYSESNDKEDVMYSEKVQNKQNDKLSIQEIYSQNGIENSDINTVFMLGNFINALPDSLPYEVRKKSLISILSSSNTDLMKLMGDGKRRLDALKQFSREYYDSTVGSVEDYKRKIAELKNQINIYEEQISNNETKLREQNNIIKYEMDKIEGIINFINNGD